MIAHMHALIKHNSDAHRVKQQKAMNGAKPGETLMTSTEWPLVLACTGQLELKALERLRKVAANAADMFDCCLPEEKTLHESNIMFKMISRQMVRFSDMLDFHTQTFPFLMFLFLVRPEEALTKVKSLCPKLRDAWSHGFIEHWGLDNLTCPGALGELMIIAIIRRLNTLELENGNASIKFALDVLSTHVKTPALHLVSANRFLTRFRNQRNRRQYPPGSKKQHLPQKGKRQKQVDAQRKREGKPPIKRREKRWRRRFVAAIRAPDFAREAWRQTCQHEGNRSGVPELRCG